jgi:hypothetical protein
MGLLLMRQIYRRDGSHCLLMLMIKQMKVLSMLQSHFIGNKSNEGVVHATKPFYR